MSEYDDGSGYDGGHEAYASGHEEYGQDQQHDAQYAGVAESDAAEHDAAYAHGHQVEYDAPGVHYQESDFTDAGEHDAAADNLQAAEFSDHDAAESFGDASLTEFDAEHADAFFAEHGLTGPEHMELPGAGDLPGADDHGAPAHLGSGEQNVNPYNRN